MNQIKFLFFLCTEEEMEGGDDERCSGSARQSEDSIDLGETDCPTYPSKEGNCTSSFKADAVAMTIYTTGEKFALNGERTATFSMHHSEAHEECVYE